MSSAPSRSRTRPDRLARALERAVAALVVAIVETGRADPVVLVDGRSGAGKTSLTARLVASWPLPDPVQSIPLDALYPGWDGLAAGVDYARAHILEPHARGVAGTWQRWDWERAQRAEEHTVEASRALIVEGAGILTPATAALSDVRVWVDAPADARRDRALSRDGDTYRPHWERWAAQEDAHLTADDPRSLATLVFTLP